MPKSATADGGRACFGDPYRTFDLSRSSVSALVDLDAAGGPSTNQDPMISTGDDKYWFRLVQFRLRFEVTPLDVLMNISIF